MPKASSDILKKLLKNRLDTLGYASLKQFHADRRTLGLSYELLRQVIYAGRIPRSETLLRILEELQFSPSQSRKVLETCFGVYAGRSPAPVMAASPPEPAGAARTEGPPADAPRPGGADISGRDPAELLAEGPEEVAARLARDLPRIPLEGNDDFWEVARHLAVLAGRKVQELARRQVDQPLLFEKEPEAIYQFLVRRGKIPPYMSRGENLALGYEPGLDYRDRFRGALLGAAFGELLGAPAQGLTPRDIRELYGRIEGLEGVRRREPSVLVAARSLLAGGGAIDPARLAPALSDEGRAGKGAGGSGGKTLDIPWFERGISVPDCLPAARVPAVALLRAGDFRRLKLEAGLLAAVMRPNPSAIFGAIVQAAAVAKALHGQPEGGDAIGFARSIAHVIEGLEPDRVLKTRGGKPPASLARRLGTDLPALLLRRAEIEEIREVLGNGAAAHEGVPFAWACFLCAPDDFDAAVLTAANQGNASEETASMTGALCGARLGASGIPRKFLDPLPFREEIEAVADGLLALARVGAG